MSSISNQKEHQEDLLKSDNDQELKNDATDDERVTDAAVVHSIQERDSNPEALTESKNVELELSCESAQHPVHPDGGWGWFVVFGSALAHFLVVGVGRSFGLFYLELLDRFQQSAAATAWVIALHNTLRQVLGPLVGILCNRFTCRWVVIAGGLIMCLGCVISAFATSLIFMYLSFSVLAGTGAALIFSPSYVIVSQYFDKKKGKAMGISTIGAGFGSVALAPVITLLLHLEGYYGTMFIMGGIMLNNCVAGALYRPLPSFTKNRSKMKKTDIDKDRVQKSRLGKCAKGLEILKNATFLLYGLQIMSMSVCIQTYLTFLPGIAREYGVDKNKASALLSYVGIADMLSRFIWGFFFDLKLVRYRRRLFHACLGIPMGCFAILNGTMSSYPGFITVTLLWGLVEGGFHSQRATIVSEFVEKKQMSSTVGFVIAFQGVGNLLGPPIGGFIHDRTGSYDRCYYFAGACLIATSTIFLLNHFLRNIFLKKTKEADLVKL